MLGVREFALALVACLAVLALPALAQSAAEADALNQQAFQLYQQGKYAEATELAKRALAIREAALGPDHPDVGGALSNLAMLYRGQGRSAEAEPIFRRSLAIYEKALGPDHRVVGTLLNNLAELYRAQGRYGEAEPLYQRSIAIHEKALGPDHPEVGSSLNNLAQQYLAQARYAEAEPIFRRSLAIYEKALGPDHAAVGTMLNNLAALYQAQGRYPETEPLHKRGLAILEKALGPDHPNVGQSFNNLAELYQAQGRYVEAEPLYKRALAIWEKALGPYHPEVGRALSNLAALYTADGRYVEAEPLYKRALAITEKALGIDHAEVGIRLNNLAGLYLEQGRYAEAEPIFRRSLAIGEKVLGPEHPDVGIRLNNLALLYQAQARVAEAEPLYQRSLAIREKTLGPNHPDVGQSLNNLALLYWAQGRTAEAEPIFRRSLEIYEKTLGRDHPSVGSALNNLAGLHFVQQDWVGAADYWRRSTALAVRRAERGTADVGQALTGKRKGETDRQSYRFLSLVRVGYRLATQDRAQQAGLAAELFQAAQWAVVSEAAGSLAQMAARGAKGDARLAALVRERQDLVVEWQKRDANRTAAVSQPSDKRDKVAEATNEARLAAIDARITEIDKQLIAKFPNYAALAKPTPLTVEEVQAQLGASEALVLILDTPEWKPAPEETFIWIVTKTDARWVRSDLGTAALTREVAALRCGLSASQWDDDGLATRCRTLLNMQPERDTQGNARTETLPFDHARAHALYQALFGQVEDLIRDKHLLIVPSGPLTQLPFQVLVTAVSNQNYRTAAWLARKHAITVLPAVSSLKALRRVARPSAASKPMLGIGNPLLDGDPDSRPWEAKWAQLARDKQACPQTLWPHVAGLTEKRRDVRVVATRNGRADLDHLRSQPPLHDTADELCAVAKDLRLSPDDILLGARATEATLKSLSDSGKLSQYRVVHFATHGAIAGEIEGTREPGLILTPPKEQTDLDDGYLSSSEVAALKLDADWVILSACNTAAGGAKGAEALSGLARAFIYAGARALLVSHWSVDSAATVKLVSSAIGSVAKTVGRAEALRRAMLALIDKGEPHEAHPAYWAPFVVVGEGAAR